MTPKEINIAIAEACGWTEIRNYTHSDDGAQELGGHRPGTPRGCWSWLPNYHGSLDAMHEAEKTLTDAQREDCAINLDEMFNGTVEGVGFDMDKDDRLACRWSVSCLTKILGATAAQRAEAFLRTLGKWKDT